MGRYALKVSDALIRGLEVEGSLRIPVVAGIGVQLELGSGLITRGLTMVAVVGSDDLDVVHADAALGPLEAVLGVAGVIAGACEDGGEEG